MIHNWQVNPIYICLKIELSFGDKEAFIPLIWERGLVYDMHDGLFHGVASRPSYVFSLELLVLFSLLG